MKNEKAVPKSNIGKEVVYPKYILNCNRLLWKNTFKVFFFTFFNVFSKA